MTSINALRSPETTISYMGRVGDGGEAYVSALRIANALLRRRVLVVLIPFCTMVSVTLVRLALPKTYTTTASFAPQITSQGSTLQGLAAQFGIGNSQASDPTQQPIFYEKLARTPELLRGVVTTRYATEGGGRADSIDLSAAFRINGATARIREDRAIEYLRDHITATADPVTGVIRLEITLRDPKLSLAVTQRLLSLVNDFNARYRREQAESELRFTEERDAAARADLRRAEDSLAEFLLRNRQYQNDPRLTSEHDRLAREVGIRQDLFTSLAQHLQQSALDAVRSTPVIHVIEHPILPAEPTSRRLLLTMILSLASGLVVTVLLVIMPELIAASGAEDPRAYESYLQLRAAAASDLRRLRAPWRSARQHS